MRIFEKVYELPLMRDYVAHWGVTEAVRELLQNAIDSDSPFDCRYINGVLRITSANSSLPVRSLLLGATSKATDENAIGSFGEGYKIAMLVLLRNEKRLTIYNDDVTWRPEFRVSKVYGEETIHVVEEDRPIWNNDRLIFHIDGIDEDEWAEIQKSCLHLQDDLDIGEVIEVNEGRILTQCPGKIYVNGLFVCDMDLDYGYDIHPKFITLERDRQTVSSWDVKVLAKNMWFQTGDMDRVAEMIEEGCQDLQHADWNTPEIVKEACYKLFRQKHPGAIAVKTQAELDKYVANGMTNTVVVNNTFHGALASYSRYDKEATVLILDTPSEVLSKWMRDNKGYMRKEAIVTFKAIINKSNGWKNK
jgi:hypothetical protein